MHRTLTFLLFLALVPPAVGQDAPTPVLSELYPDPDTGREFVELHNPTDVAIDLSGWRVQDVVGNGHTFTGRLDPGAYLVLWSGGQADALGPAMSSATVWNNDGDTATLLDPSGAVVDSLTYGTAGVPAPPKGQSLNRGVDGWVQDAPSPGAARGQQVGTVTLSVSDVPPEVAFVSVPPRLRPGEAGTVSIRVHEPNGDPVTWTLSHGAQLLYDESAGTQDLVVRFDDPGDAVLTLHAEDAAGNAAETTATIPVAQDALRVVLPPGGIRFPSLPPGGGPVDADASFRLVNEGTTSGTPRIDLSDLKGSTASIPVAGHLLVGTRSDETAEWSWTSYDGPLTALPLLPSGAGVDVLLRLLDVPDLLPAGDYHTSFTVVP